MKINPSRSIGTTRSTHTKAAKTSSRTLTPANVTNGVERGAVDRSTTSGRGNGGGGRSSR
jgi:hypothetical protein